MKIIYLANYRLPTEKAHGLQIAKMCEAFALTGTSVELVYPERITEINEDLFQYYAVKRVFGTAKLRVRDLVGTMPFGFILTSLFFTAAAYAYLKKNGIKDRIYCRDIFALLAAVLYGKAPIAFEMHSLPKRLSVFHRLLLGKVTRFITINDYLHTTLAHTVRIPDEKIVTAHDGVDLDPYASTATREECRKALGFPPGQTIVLYAGHLYPWKGVYTLADASVVSPEKVLFYLVGGTGHDIDVMRSYLREKNISRTVLLGHHRPQEIPSYLYAADILVLPNTATSVASRLYTSPMKLFEYMASERPIVASDVPSLHEVLNDNNALFVKPDDSNALAAGIRRLIENPDLARRLADQARRDVVQYSWKARAARIRDILKDTHS